MCFETDTVTANYDFYDIFVASGNILGASGDFSNLSINEAEKTLKIHHQFIKHHLALGTIYTSRQNRKI